MNQKKKISLKPELQRFIENIAAIYEGYGIPRIGGRIFGLSLVYGEPLSAEDMSALLQASRSSISTNIRALMLNGWKRLPFLEIGLTILDFPLRLGNEF